jgi:hypothetical protein
MKTFRYIAFADIEAYESLGWKVVGIASHYSVIMEAPDG